MVEYCLFRSGETIEHPSGRTLPKVAVTLTTDP
jgi:hypothetical protein